MNENGGPLVVFNSPDGQGGNNRHQEEPPARVQVALAYLRDVTFKQMTRAAINDISIELIDGPKLKSSEEAAQLAACDMLEMYFQGRMQMDMREKTQQKEMQRLNAGATLLSCIACQGSGVRNCSMCRGTGRILVYPATEGE